MGLFKWLFGDAPNQDKNEEQVFTDFMIDDMLDEDESSDSSGDDDYCEEEY